MVKIKKISKRLSKDTKIHLLFIGRNPVRKGLYDVLKAFDEISKETEEITFDIVSSLPEKVVRKLQENPQINYYTNISEDLKARLLDRADILILPTYAETYGYVLIEGMAYGCALITSDYEPLNELVIEGENGFLAEPGNVEEIISKINLFLENPILLIEFAENNRKKYRDNFSEEAVIPKYVDAFGQTLMKEKNSKR